MALNEQDSVDVTDRYDVFGSVSDIGGVNYQLLYRDQGADTWRRFAQNSDSEFNGVLGTFDPSLLKNGVYELVLYAENGFDLALSRTYDNRDAIGDFGPGWNLPSSEVAVWNA